MLLGANLKQGENSRFGMNLRNDSYFGCNQPEQWQNWYSRRRAVGTEKSWRRDGDWLCPNSGCRNVDFRFRKFCNWCRVARPVRTSRTLTDENGGESSTITVQMTADELRKWYQFKEMKQSDKRSREAATVSADLFGNNSASSEGNCSDKPWLIDSGASRHMAGSYKDFYNYILDCANQHVKLADGSIQSIKGSGDVKCTPHMTLSSVMHVPSFPINLMSVGCITNELNCAVIFLPYGCIFQELGTGKILGTGTICEGLYYLNGCMSTAVAATLSMSPTDEFLILHRRLGHIPFMKLGQLYPSLYGKVDKGKLVCDACEFGKHIRSSYLLSDNRSAKPFQTIHSDVWGPSGVVSINGYRYFVTFIDCCTRTTWLYVLRNKNDVFECFRDFHNLVMNQYNAQLQIFRTDNGTEYVNKLFDEYLSSFGIIHQTTCPGASEQNGLAERKNRHLLEVTRCLMMEMNVPKFLWGEAAMTAAYLINRMPTRVLGDKTPIECLTGKTTYVVPPKVFGCVCFVRDHRPSMGKLDPRALKCVFVGYSGKQKGYKCWCPSERRMFISMDVTFRENAPFYGEPTDLTDVFPDLFNDDSSDGVLRAGGDERREDNDATSQKMIVGVIPTGDEPDGRDEDTSNTEQDHTQGEQQVYQPEGSRWRKNLQVYSRRHRVEKDQVQGEEDILLRQSSETQGYSDIQEPNSSPSASDGSKTIPRMEESYDGGDGGT